MFLLTEFQQYGIMFYNMTCDYQIVTSHMVLHIWNVLVYLINLLIILKVAFFLFLHSG